MRIAVLKAHTVCEFVVCVNIRVFGDCLERCDMVVLGNESPSFNFPVLITLAFNHLSHEPYWHFRALVLPVSHLE